MEAKICFNCGKEFKCGLVWNGWKTYKIMMPKKTWQRKKFCTRNCGKNYYARKLQQTDKWKEYKKKWMKENMDEERKKRYYENRKPKQKEYYDKLKKEKPEQYKKYTGASKKRLKEIRKKIFDIYDNKCAVCGFKEVLELHHIDENNRKYKQDWSNPKNIMVLCPNHHTIYHRGKLSKKELLKYIVE